MYNLQCWVLLIAACAFDKRSMSNLQWLNHSSILGLKFNHLIFLFLFVLHNAWYKHYLTNPLVACVGGQGCAIRCSNNVVQDRQLVADSCHAFFIHAPSKRWFQLDNPLHHSLSLRRIALAQLGSSTGSALSLLMRHTVYLIRADGGWAALVYQMPRIRGDGNGYNVQ